MDVPDIWVITDKVDAVVLSVDHVDDTVRAPGLLHKLIRHTKDVDIDDAVMGSTVEQVVLRFACPVASVNKPDRL